LRSTMLTHSIIHSKEHLRGSLYGVEARMGTEQLIQVKREAWILSSWREE
jgi:hypothetical protein